MAIDNNDEQRPSAVTVSLNDLKNSTVSLETLEKAFGPSSLGIIIVKDLPEEFVDLRARLLSYSSYLANLPAEELALVEIPAANYNIGWSCGKETLRDGRYDTLKGSYYAQPIHDAALESKAKTLYPHVPEFTTPNVWPQEAVLPGFQDLFERMCRLIVDVAGFVARNCDRYGVQTLEDYRDGTLETIVRESVSTKARLLHYFPLPSSSSSPAANGNGNETDGKQDEKNDNNNDDEDDDWCATHRDLGALTGLTSQMFIDEAVHSPRQRQQQQQQSSTDNNNNLLPILPELDSHPDPNAGLWIQDRAGRTTQVHIPRDCLAFQTGQALELITRGKFKAVPHFVRGGSAAAAQKGAVDEKKKMTTIIARNTLAVFTQPNLWEVVDGERDFAELGQFTLRSQV